MISIFRIFPKCFVANPVAIIIMRAHTPRQSLISRYAQTIGIFRYYVKRPSAIRYIVTTKTKYNKNMLN